MASGSAPALKVDATMVSGLSSSVRKLWTVVPSSSCRVCAFRSAVFDRPAGSIRSEYGEVVDVDLIDFR